MSDLASETTTASCSSAPSTANSTTGAPKKNETTLTHLTKRFIRLLNSSSERVVNLNEASARLNVAKRRIYDITNVLEGIGLLQKTSKNVTRWLDCPLDSPFAAPLNDRSHPKPQVNNVNSSNSNSNNNNNTSSTINNNNTSLDLNGFADAELLALLKTHRALEEGLENLKAEMKQVSDAEGAYVTYHDIRSFFDDQIVIAVRGPPGSKLEVLRGGQIYIKSETGEIEAYLCPHHGTSTTNSNNNNNNNNSNNNSNSNATQQFQPGAHPSNNTSLHLQQSQLSNSSNTQPLDAANTNNMIGQQPHTTVSSDEGRGRSTLSTTDGQYYDPTSSVSNEDHYFNNDPTLSSALSGTMSEDEEPFRPLVPFEAREETHYNFMLDDNYTITSLFPEDEFYS